MSDSPPAASWRRSLCEYGTAVILCVVLLALLTRPWRTDLRVPFCYSWDGILTCTLIKGIHDNGWFLHNPYLGAPGGRDLHDFPFVDNLHLLILKGIVSITGDFGLTYNLYFLLTFPLTTLTALFALRHFGIGYGPALVTALLYSFLPYPFWRCAAGHLFLASFYLVPLIVLVIVGIYLDRRVLVSLDDETNRLRWHVGSGRTLGAVLVCLLVSSAGVYYAFFACFFLLVAGLSAALSRRRAYPLVPALTMTVLIVLGVLASVAPTLRYKWENGPNTDAVARCPQGAEFHGLKLVQLLLPADSHRIPALAEVRRRYNALAPLANENGWSGLGLVGGGGFLFLCGRLLVRRASARPKLLDGFAVLTAAGLALATVGGFGSLLSFLVTDWIRGYTRISVYLAFFALAAVALLFDKAARHFSVGRRRLLFCGFLAFVLLGGVYDQVSFRWKPPFAWVYGDPPRDYVADYHHDAAWVRCIEDSLPPHAQVFQLPYVPYPEYPPVHGMTDYDHFRGYLHSRTLHWSYGTIKGRGSDGWQRSLAALPPAELPAALAYAGFRGLYLDRAGYADRAASLETALVTLLDTSPVISDNGRFVFFNLTDFAERLKKQLSEAEWRTRCAAASHPLLFEWRGGFFGCDGLGATACRWCSSRGELVVQNTWDQPRTVTFTFIAISDFVQPSNLQLSGLIAGQTTVGRERTPFQTTVTVPPGRHLVRFRCDGPPHLYPNDPRHLVFNLVHFAAKEVFDPPAPAPLARN